MISEKEITIRPDPSLTPGPPIFPTNSVEFVVRPSGGSLYLGFRLITNFRLKAELRTSCFHTVSEVGGSFKSCLQNEGGSTASSNTTTGEWVDRSSPA